MIDGARKCVVVALAGGLGALAVVVVGCTGDDTPAGVLPDASRADTRAPEADVVQPKADAGALAKVQVVHASPDLPAVRVCFALGVKVDGSDGVAWPLPPLPDRAAVGQPFPGIFPGNAVALDDLGVDLSAKVVVPYVLLATSVSADAKTDAGPASIGCDALLSSGADGLAPTAFLKLAPMPPGTFNRGDSVMLGVTGCLPQALDPAASASLCGTGYSAITGNVSLKILKLDTKFAGSPEQLGAQLAHLSSPAQGSVAASGLTGALFSPSAPDGGAAVTLAVGSKFGDLSPQLALPVSLGTVDDATLNLTGTGADGGGAQPLAQLGLPLIYTLTTGQLGSAAGYFKQGANYTFIVVGDPAQASLLDGGAVNGRALHALGLRSDPDVSKYAP